MLRIISTGQFELPETSTDTIRAGHQDFGVFSLRRAALQNPKDFRYAVADQTSLRCRRFEPQVLAATSPSVIATPLRNHAWHHPARVNCLSIVRLAARRQPIARACAPD